MAAPLSSLSPHEYLEYLQHVRYGSTLPPFAADVGDVLSAHLIASLPAEHRSKLDRIAIGVLPTKSINAFVMQVPSGGEVIAFDFGTLSFMLSLNRILLSRITLFGFEPTLTLPAAADLAAQTVRAFFEEKDLPRLPVSPRRMLIASALSNSQTSFIVGHELGHVLLGHLREYPEDGPPEHLHDMEFDADARGAELVLSAFAKDNDPLFGAGDTSVAQAGFDLFFTYMSFVERVMLWPDSGSNSTHPSNSERQTRLRRRFLSQMPESARALAVTAQAVFADFESIIGH